MDGYFSRIIARESGHAPVLRPSPISRYDLSGATRSPEPAAWLTDGKDVDLPAVPPWQTTAPRMPTRPAVDGRAAPAFEDTSGRSSASRMPMPAAAAGGPDSWVGSGRPSRSRRVVVHRRAVPVPAPTVGSTVDAKLTSGITEHTTTSPRTRSSSALDLTSPALTSAMPSGQPRDATGADRTIDAQAPAVPPTLPSPPQPTSSAGDLTSATAPSAALVTASDRTTLSPGISRAPQTTSPAPSSSTSSTGAATPANLTAATPAEPKTTDAATAGSTNPNLTAAATAGPHPTDTADPTNANLTPAATAGPHPTGMADPTNPNRAAADIAIATVTAGVATIPSERTRPASPTKTSQATAAFAGDAADPASTAATTLAATTLAATTDRLGIDAGAADRVAGLLAAKGEPQREHVPNTDHVGVAAHVSSSSPSQRQTSHAVSASTTDAHAQPRSVERQAAAGTLVYPDPDDQPLAYTASPEGSRATGGRHEGDAQPAPEVEHRRDDQPESEAEHHLPLGVGSTVPREGAPSWRARSVADGAGVRREPSSSASSPEIRVRIGRLDLRAPRPPASVPAGTPEVRRPNLSLDSYLAKRGRRDQ
jgi:hypothetical protein